MLSRIKTIWRRIKDDAEALLVLLGLRQPETHEPFGG